MLPRPTTRGWLVTGMALVVFAGTMVNPGFIPALLTAFLVALTGTSFIQAALASPHLAVTRGPGEEGTVGQQMNLPLFLRNLSRRRSALLIVEEHCGCVLHRRLVHAVSGLAAGEERFVRRRTYLTARGEYALGEIRVMSGDVGGLFRVVRRFHCPCSVIVYPDSEPLESLPLGRRDRVSTSSGGRPIGLSGVGQEFFGIREYRHTDSFRSIHWKASARRGRLVSREFEENSVAQVTVLLDTQSAGRGAAEGFEFQVRVAATLLRYLSGAYCQLCFAAGNAEAPVEGGAQAVADQAMQILATVGQTERPMRELIEMCLPSIVPDSVVYCLTAGDTGAVLDGVDGLLGLNVDLRWVHAPGAMFADLDEDAPIDEAPTLQHTGRMLRPVVVTPTTGIAALLTYG